MKVLRNIDVSGKSVFVRADLDVPLEELAGDGLQFTEIATRLTNIKQTVDYLLEHGAKRVLIAGHIDRPSVAKALEGKPEFYDQALSTNQLLAPLEKILRRSVSFRADLNSEDSGTINLFSQLLLFENLRFWSGETKNDLEFANKLARLADIYVNDAFGNCHREHASMASLPKLLPHAAGVHLEEEVNQLTKLTRDPTRPFVAIVGGVKLETKLPVIESLARVADEVLVGGKIAKELTVNSSQLIVGQNVSVANLTEDTRDIDEVSIEKFKSIIARAKTIVWNGPMGLFEEGFEKGTAEVANAIVKSGTYSVVGGGETTHFLASKKLLGQFSFVSSGGGAMLEFLSGKELPGVKALE